MNNQNNVGGAYSWPVIIIALICFWPVGLFLLAKRMSKDRKAAMGSGKIMKGFGIAFCIFAVLGLLVSLDNFDGSSVVAILFFAVAGIALWYFGDKKKKEAASIRQYLSIIVNGGERRIDSISSATGKNYNVVKNDIQKLIDDGFLKNAYINENTHEVVLTNSVPTTPVTPVTPNVNIGTTATTVNSMPQLRTVVCPCCGANNTITGTSGECEYCGSALR